MILKNATSSCVTKVECICLQEYLSFYALSFLKMSPKDHLPQLENVYVFRQSCRLIKVANSHKVFFIPSRLLKVNLPCFVEKFVESDVVQYWDRTENTKYILRLSHL